MHGSGNLWKYLFSNSISYILSICINFYAKTNIEDFIAILWCMHVCTANGKKLRVKNNNFGFVCT